MVSPKKVSVEDFNSDLRITLIQSFQTSLNPVGLYVLVYYLLDLDTYW